MAVASQTDRPDVIDRGPGPPPLIELLGVGKRFWKGGTSFQALGDVSLAIPAGEFVAVVGPSGCGKSTLLNMIAGLMEPSSGSVRYRDEPVADVNTRVGYITQKDNLMPWRTVEGNIALGLELRHLDADERRERVAAVIALVGLGGFEQHYPYELSGGMRKRVTLARTLVYEPETLLMDEPFGALDAQLKLVLQEELLRIWQADAKTVVFVTHDLDEALTLADRVVVISARPGIVKLVQPVDLARPRSIDAARADARFAHLHARLWASLREDVLKGEEI
jgi:NitT/TauT family transport system ATP-binding protein